MSRSQIGVAPVPVPPHTRALRILRVVLRAENEKCSRMHRTASPLVCHQLFGDRKPTTTTPSGETSKGLHRSSGKAKRIFATRPENFSVDNCIHDESDGTAALGRRLCSPHAAQTRFLDFRKTIESVPHNGLDRGHFVVGEFLEFALAPLPAEPVLVQADEPD